MRPPRPSRDRRQESPEPESPDRGDSPGSRRRCRREASPPLAGTNLRPIFVTIDQAGELLNLFRSSLDRLHEDGVLRRVQVLTCPRYLLAAIEAYAAKVAGEKSASASPPSSATQPPADAPPPSTRRPS